MVGRGKEGGKGGEGRGGGGGAACVHSNFVLSHSGPKVKGRRETMTMCFLRRTPPSLGREVMLTQQTGVTGRRGGGNGRVRKGRGGPPPVMGGMSVGVAGGIGGEGDKAGAETIALNGMMSTEIVMEGGVAVEGEERMERGMDVIMVGVARGEVWVMKCM